MSELPSYTDAMIALVDFVKDIAKNDKLDAELREKASVVLGDFIIAGLIKVAQSKGGSDEH